MNYREFTCLYCGAKGIDMSKTKNRKYCSVQCLQAHHYRKKLGLENKPVTFSCVHNKRVVCEIRQCDKCGWNPSVEQKRKEAFGYG